MVSGALCSSVFPLRLISVSPVAIFRINPSCRLSFDPLAKMSPKPITGSAAAEVFDALEKLGGISEEYVKLLPKAMRNRGFAALDQWKKSNPEAAAKMNETGHDASRRYLCQFVMDAKQGKIYARSTTTVQTRDGQEGTEGMITFNQLKGPNYMNSEEDATLAVKDLKAEPQWLPHLAAAGVKVYNWKTKLSRKLGTRARQGTEKLFTKTT